MALLVHSGQPARLEPHANPCTPDPERLVRAFEAYSTHHATLGQASVLAHLPLTVFLDEARRAGVLPVYHDPSWD